MCHFMGAWLHNFSRLLFFNIHICKSSTLFLSSAHVHNLIMGGEALQIKKKLCLLLLFLFLFLLFLFLLFLLFSCGHATL